MKRLIILLSVLSLNLFGQDSVPVFKVTSPAFAEGDTIPARYTCVGDNISPELNFQNIPQGTKSLAIIMDDPDAPKGTFTHWLIWNIPVRRVLQENTAPGTQGVNGRKENKYTGPCPPLGLHHYHFKVYAVDTILSIGEGTDKKTLESLLKKHIIGKAELVGVFQK